MGGGEVGRGRGGIIMELLTVDGGRGHGRGDHGR